MRVRSRVSSKGLPCDVRRILTAIHAHLFDEETTATVVCERCGVRNHNVHSRFKMYLGVTMREYIERERVEAAKTLLRETKLFAYEISDAVGYAHPETFARAFHRRVGCTPGQFRKHVEPRPLRGSRRVGGAASSGELNG